MKGDAQMSSEDLWLTLHANGTSIAVPREHALVSTTAVFVRDIHLAVGTPVVIQIRRGQEDVSLQGYVSASYADFGLCVKFNSGEELGVNKLAALLADGATGDSSSE
jgi:hypothetical protein